MTRTTQGNLILTASPLAGLAGAVAGAALLGAFGLYVGAMIGLGLAIRFGFARLAG